MIPHVGSLRKEIFQLAHDCLGYFGFNKSYDAIHNEFFWLKMRSELEGAYIPGCDTCQHNKSSTIRPAGPLYPLPIPDGRCDSIAIDFIRPLTSNAGTDGICTMTCRLGSNVRIVPIWCDQTAEEFAMIFFKHWYCKNGLPSNIILDRINCFFLVFGRLFTA